MRQAYFEHSDYVPLLRRADALWNELEDESKKNCCCAPVCWKWGQRTAW